MNTLVDSCTFLWMVCTPSRLSKRAQELLSDPGCTPLLSIMSIWELTIKYEKKPHTFAESPSVLFPKVCRYYEIDILPLAEQAIYALQNLPKHHRDPFDRILICQALAHDLTILTPDDNFRKYEVKTVW